MTAPDEQKGRVKSARDLVDFVRQAGMCYLFKRGERPRVWDFARFKDSTTGRGAILKWAEGAHLDKLLFLTVDEKGSLLAMSWERFAEMRKLAGHMALTDDEERILKALDRALSTPELRKLSALPEGRFEGALNGLR